jgi:hypothetical protein
LTLDDCVARTKTSMAWMRRAVFQKRIPIVKMGRLVRVRECDLESFIAANFTPARDPPGPARLVEVKASGSPRGTRATG